MTNRLATASSPYLLQHAENPVDWYAWGEQAFARARERDVPLFVSIGYATCHWCHVMERESFEDENIARLLNEGFVSIKVDREEHPDIDHFYMTACTAGGRRGGWPLTILALPDGRPFYVATYLPPTGVRGRPGLADVLVRVQKMWSDDRQAVSSSARDVTALVQRLEAPPEGATREFPDAARMQKSFADAVSELASSYDAGYGGFGRAPKFPAFHRLRFLLRTGVCDGSQSSMTMAVESLSWIRSGGIWDHVGHGFHRYATDRHWHLPHFEKMLYDQCMAIAAFGEAYAVTGNPLFSRTVSQLYDFLQSEYLSPDGLFYSAWDADSEGEEGKYYTWDFDHLDSLTTVEQIELLKNCFAVRAEGNFDDEASRTPSGLNVLDAGLAANEAHTVELIERFEPLRKRLDRIRSERIAPGRDEKCLTDWNGMYVAAAAIAGRLLVGREPLRSALLRSAERTASAIMTEMRSPDGVVYHRSFHGDVGVEGGLDDYAMPAWGMLELFQATGRARWLRDAIVLCDTMIDRFMDDEAETFHISRRDDLPVRQSKMHDEAYPSGTATGLDVLARLSSITGKSQYRSVCERVVARSFSRIEEWKTGHLSALSAAGFMAGQSGEIVIAGSRGSDLFTTVSATLLPNHAIIPAFDEERPALEAQVPFLASIPTGEEAVYMCTDRVCDRPVYSVEELQDRLDDLLDA